MKAIVMKTIIVLLLLSISWPSLALARVIHGSIKEGGRSVGEGVTIEIEIIVEIIVEIINNIPAGKTYTTKTDKFGSYRLKVEETGECTLKVHYMKQLPTIKIHSYERSVEYALVLERKEDGQYYLRRK